MASTPSLTAAILTHTFLQISHRAWIHYLPRPAWSPQVSCVHLPGPSPPPNFSPTGSQMLWRSGILTFLSCPHCVSSGAAALLFVILHSFVLFFLSFVQYSRVIWEVIIQLTAIVILHSWQFSFIYLPTSSVSFKVTMKRIINKFKK